MLNSNETGLGSFVSRDVMFKEAEIYLSKEVKPTDVDQRQSNQLKVELQALVRTVFLDQHDEPNSDDHEPNVPNQQEELENY